MPESVFILAYKSFDYNYAWQSQIIDVYSRREDAEVKLDEIVRSLKQYDNAFDRHKAEVVRLCVEWVKESGLDVRTFTLSQCVDHHGVILNLGRFLHADPYPSLKYHSVADCIYTLKGIKNHFHVERPLPEFPPEVDCSDAPDGCVDDYEIFEFSVNKGIS